DKAPGTSGNAGTDVIGDLRLLRDGPAKNGEVAGSGGIWPDVGSSDGSDSASDAGESSGDADVWSGDDGTVGVMMGVSAVGGVVIGVVSGMVVGIAPNKITRPAGVPVLSSDESDEIEITKVA
nr:hypothetical protein [Tanacetum cinerariifolium]